jgi:sulfite reductase beta subunit-like hemoprotein
MGRYLDIFIPMHRLNDELIERIATSLQNGTGKAQVRMRVTHEQSELLLPSNSFNKVNIEAEALKALQDIPEIEFEVSES